MLLFLASACQSGEEELLHGQWQATSVTEEGEPLQVDASEISLVLSPQGQYLYRSTLNYREAGKWYFQSGYLFTQDTLKQGSREKAVQVVKLQEDTLELRMKDGVRERMLMLTRSGL